MSDLASPAQVSFIDSLLAARDWREHKYAGRIAQVSKSEGEPLTKKGASALIDLLKGLPFKSESADTVTIPEIVPAGRYAIDTEPGSVNDVAFYKVDRPTEGKWAGYVFVKLMSGDEEIRLNRNAGAAVLMKIEVAGIEASSARYGHLIGECGICGRTLTNEESRARGIGPVCANRMGW